MLTCCHFSCVWVFETPWTVAHQAPLSMGFPRQEYWRGLPCPPPGDLLDWGTEPKSLMSYALESGFFTTSTNWEAQFWIIIIKNTPWWGLRWSCVCFLQMLCFLHMFSSLIESHYYFPSFCPLNSAHHKIISQISFLLPAENCQMFRGLIHRAEFSKERSGVLLHVRVG